MTNQARYEVVIPQYNHEESLWRCFLPREK